MSISIYNTGSANISSLKRCLNKIGIKARLSENIDECILSSNKIILPGIGNMKILNDFKKQIRSKLLNFIKSEKNYLLGICLGAQAMMNNSEESNDRTLGFIDGDCKKVFDLAKINLNVGYKKIKRSNVKNDLLSKLFFNIPDESKYYFLHKYYIHNNDKSALGLKTEVNKENFDCVLIKKNIIAVQFHPELSKKPGELFLKNFSKL